MKKIITLGFLSMSLASPCFSQSNWQSPNNLSISGFWDMDTLNGKLYISTGLVNEYDGTDVTVLNDYNNSLNTPNKTKSAVASIDGKLYCGAKDFNTKGEGDVHYYNGSSWSLFQNSKFQYNGSYKVRKFVKYNNEIYMSGLFAVPNSTFSNIAKWSGTDWVSLGKDFISSFSKNEIFDLQVFGSKLYLTDGGTVWSYDGAKTDSLFNPYTGGEIIYPYVGMVNDMVVYNGSLYISGSFMLESGKPQSLIVQYNGSSVQGRMESLVGLSGLSNYEQVRRMAVVENVLLFIAKRIDDEGTYLVKYDGNSVVELGKLASKGDFAFFPGSEITNYNKMMAYKGNLYIGGNFSKIGGQAVSGLASLPLSEVVSGINEEKNTGSGSLKVWIPSKSDVIKVESSSIPVKRLGVYNQLGLKEASYDNLGLDSQVQFDSPSGIYLYQIELKNSQIIKGKFVKN